MSSGVITETIKTAVSEDKIESGNDLEYLDIPAFLRKQAD
jgi:cell division protein FtsZ